MDRYEIYLDGGTLQSNPGIGYGRFRITNLEYEHSAYGYTYNLFITNHEAMYFTIVVALSELRDIYQKNARVFVYLNSKLVVKQLNDQWKINDTKLLILYNAVKFCCEDFAKVDFIWVEKEIIVSALAQ
jgi:ribonuclease HI